MEQSDLQQTLEVLWCSARKYSIGTMDLLTRSLSRRHIHYRVQVNYRRKWNHI